MSASQKRRNKRHGGVRDKVEHAFHVLKCQFGHRKTRCCRLAKNRAHLFTLMALSHLERARKRLPGAPV